MTSWKDENGNTCFGVKQVKKPKEEYPAPKKQAPATQKPDK